MSHNDTTHISFDLSRRLICFFLVSVLAIYAAGLTVTLRLRKNAEQDWQTAYISQTEEFAAQLDGELTRICAQMKYTLTRSVTLWLTLVPEQTSFPALYDSVQRMTNQIYTLQNTSSLIESSSVYFPALDKCIHSFGTYNSPSEEERQLIEAYYDAPGHSAVLASGGELYLVSDASNFTDKTTTALVWTQLSARILENLCSQHSENGQAALVLSLDNGGFCAAYSKADDISYADMLEDGRKSVEMQQIGLEQTEVQEAECMRIVQPVGAWNLQVIRYANALALQEVTAPFTVWIAVQTVIMLAAVGVFLILVRQLITQPFHRIIKQLQTLEQTGLLPTESRSGGRDMDFLHSAFVQLGNHLQTTLEQVYYNRELAYQSQIKFLQAQINPHFLYNSFYHLYRMAKMDDSEGVAEMSLKLSSYYRYITRSAQNVVTLAMEYQNIVDYTEIQAIRFGDRITVQLEPLPEQYQELSVPRFILQPMFENAYTHGVEKIENGIIQLRFESDDTMLHIFVENNGDCPDADLDALQQYLNSSDRQAECTALKNVQLRMQMLGGDLQVGHGTLGGFGVCLHIPLHATYLLDTADSEEGRTIHAANTSDR